MASLTIRHVTTYRYRRPVAFGEHRMMLRPRDSHRQRVIEARLRISPEPISLRFVQDAFGNHIGVARFSGRSKALRFDSLVRIEHGSQDAYELDARDLSSFPVEYSADVTPDLGHYIGRRQADPDDEIGRWARQFLPTNGSIGAYELLDRLSRGIYRDFHYKRREAKGIQPPLETLQLGHGSCRDFAVLMIEAARSFGLAARFASGYLANPLDEGEGSFDGPGHGSTHAWAQVYLPDAGWIDFDPTHGGADATRLVTVAVVRDPSHAIPLHGTFTGLASDPVGMEVHVSVTSETPAAVSTFSNRSLRPRIVRLG